MAGLVKPRTVKNGNIELVYGVVTELEGKNLAGVTWLVSHVPDGTTLPGAGEAPHALSGLEPGSTSIYNVGKLVTATLASPTTKEKWRVFVRAADSPEIVWINCGTYTIVP